MLLCISIILIAFMWMLVETDFLCVRLPMGKCKSNEYVEALTQMLNANFAVIDRYLVIKPKVLEIPQFCERTKFINEFKDSRYKPHWQNVNRPESFQTMVIGKTKIKILATASNLYDMIKEIQKVQTEKHKPKQIRMNFPSIPLVETHRVGSHKEEFTDWQGKKYNRIVEDYNTCFNDCLPGKEWLEAHYKDEYPEPTIEISVDNGKSFHMNGDYK
ncbi:MAG: hypothetical protein WC554_17315, partial [Clostridia bacterium]